jgi:hypothetical protein
MVLVTEPQVWTLIGVFSAALLGMVTFSHTHLVRVIRAEVDRIETKFDAKLDAVETKFGARLDAVEKKFDAKFDAVEARLGAKIDGLDKDITAINRHIWGDPPTTNG